MINIVRKGIWPIPDEARTCPVCGKRKEIYSFILEDKIFTHLLGFQYKNNAMDIIQKFPTFTCNDCQTIWQYLGEEDNDE